MLTSSGDWGSVEAVVGGDRMRRVDCGLVGGRPGVCTDTRVEWDGWSSVMRGRARRGLPGVRSELFCRQRQRISTTRWRALSVLPCFLRQAMGGILSVAKILCKKRCFNLFRCIHHSSWNITIVLTVLPMKKRPCLFPSLMVFIVSILLKASPA